MRRFPVFTLMLALLLVVLAVTSLTTEGLSALKEVDVELVSELTKQTPRSERGCTWWDYTCDIYYYAYIPSDEDGDPFAQRFPVETPCTLKTIQMTMHNDFPEFSDVSGLGIDVMIWNDDGSGLPGVVLHTVNVPSVDLVYNPEPLLIDVESAGLVFNDDFHIGYTTVDQVNDCYGILADDGTCGDLRSSHFYMGIWEPILDHFGQDINFLIAAEVCGPSVFVAHFKTADGLAPYPFDVTISDGENVQTFIGVDSVYAVVPEVFTLRLGYDVDSHFVMADFEMSLEPASATKFEFYAIDPNTVSGRTTPYLIGKEIGTTVDLQWDYSEIDTTLTYTVATTPLERHVFVGTWIQAVTDDDQRFVTSWAMLNGQNVTVDTCTNGEDFKHDVWGTCIGYTELDAKAIKTTSDKTEAIASFGFSQIDENKVTVGIRKATDNGVRIPGYDVALLTPDMQSHEPDFHYPQWALPPDSSYCLEMTSNSPDHASLTYPLLIPDSTNALIFDPYLPPIAELAPYNFRIAGENTFANSSYSDLEYYPGDSMVVNVSTDMPGDWWGCFVLPDDQEFDGLVAYTETGGVETLEYFTDWFKDDAGDYDLVTVRIDSSYNRIKLACVDISGKISGRKFHDKNANSDWDLGEPPLQDFEINLTGPTPMLPVLTDAQGQYTFIGLAEGTYYVSETINYPWAQTYPPSVDYKIDVQDYDNHTDIDFGNDSCDVTDFYTTDTCVHGTKDNFVGPEPSYVSPELLEHLQATCNYNIYFDSPCDNQNFGHTFDNCWTTKCLVVEAELCFNLRATGDMPGSDSFHLGKYGPGGTGTVWWIYLNDLEEYCTPGSSPWQSGDELECCIDLKNLPAAGFGSYNILTALQDGDLDIIIQDDTEVDYIEMRVTVNCPDSGACCACDSLNQIYCFYTDRQVCLDSNGVFYAGQICDQIDCDTATCYACGDVNNDGKCLTVADLVFLKRFLFYGKATPDPLYQANLNCDGVVDKSDYDVYVNYFIWGLPAFPCGYPAPTICCPEIGTICVPGDADGSDEVDIDDVVYLLNYIFAGGPEPVLDVHCGDADCSDEIDIDDVVYLINYIFAGGPAPGDTC